MCGLDVTVQLGKLKHNPLPLPDPKNAEDVHRPSTYRDQGNAPKYKFDEKFDQVQFGGKT